MSKKIAVAIIHGVGKQDSRFADGMKRELTNRFASQLPAGVVSPKEEIVIEPVYWAPVLQSKENLLWRKVKKDTKLDWMTLRQFLIDFAADALAYQPSPKERDVYDSIHEVVAHVLQLLARRAGPDAPLAVVAHSLGSTIASNYFYDLQKSQTRALSAKVQSVLGSSPSKLESGETFARFFTLGSPLAIWSLRYAEFGTPVRLTYHDKEWLNLFDTDDTIGYPLKNLNKEYNEEVTKDICVDVGTWLTKWNPASHLEYWNDKKAIFPIADSLARLWKGVNATGGTENP